MARFDVYPGARGRGYLLDCQADYLSDLGTRVVVPLLPSEGLPRPTRLHPIFNIAEKPHIMSTHLLFAIPTERLGRTVMDLRDEHDRIMNALDMLLTGI